MCEWWVTVLAVFGGFSVIVVSAAGIHFCIDWLRDAKSILEAIYDKLDAKDGLAQSDNA